MLSPKFNVTLLNFSSERINTDQLIHQFGSLEALSITTEERLYAKSKNTTQRRSDLKEPEEPNHERLFTTIGEEKDTIVVSISEIESAESRRVSTNASQQSASIFPQPRNYVVIWI